MLISSYNPTALGDVLIITTAQTMATEQKSKQFGDLVKIYRSTDNQVVGYNLFNASQYIEDLARFDAGQVLLSVKQVSAFNDVLIKAGLVDQPLVADLDAKFVVGHVLTSVEHPNSDHLHITTVDVGLNEPLQIVCGAPNIAQDQLVVVALVGAMMPDGKIIWPGELRGVTSLGMICSAKELGVKNAPAKHGILELTTTYKVGQAFVAANYQLA